MASSYEQFFRNHPQPRKINLYVTTSFGPENPGTTPYLEYDYSGQEDYIRYRMFRLWSKNPSDNSVEMLGDSNDPPYKLGNMFLPTAIPYDETETTPPNSFNVLQYNRKEDVIIQYNPSYIDEAGNPDQGPAMPKQDKWMLSLISDNDLVRRNSTLTGPAPIPKEGIVGVFDKLPNPDLSADSPNNYQFLDFSFDYDAPLNKKSVGDNYYGSVAVSLAEVKPVYNFYVKSYESVISNPTQSLQPPRS